MEMCGLEIATLMQSRLFVLITFSVDMPKGVSITAVVAYNVHAIFVSVSTRRRKRFVVNGHMPVGLLQVYCTQEQVEKEGKGNGEEMSMYGLI